MCLGDIGAGESCLGTSKYPPVSGLSTLASIGPCASRLDVLGCGARGEIGESKFEFVDCLDCEGREKVDRLL